jgi:hypothetical protein
VILATVDANGTEHADGHVVVGDDGRIGAVGAGWLALCRAAPTG